MKKFIAIILALSLTTTIMGCSRKPKKDQQSPEPSISNQDPTSPSTPADPTAPTESFNETMVAVSVCATTTNKSAEDGTVLFKRTTQKMNLVLHKPEVAEKIIIDFLTRIDSTNQPAAEIEAMATSAYKNNSNWIPYFYHLAYSPARIDKTVLSLYGDKVIYSGTAHPDRFRVSASYDLDTGDVLTLASIMTTEAKTDDFCKLVLEGLSTRAEGDYLYENYAEVVKQRFNTDASLDEAWYFTGNGLCFYFVPYEIAPYSSGVITVEIPYEKLQGLVYPTYIPAKRATATGNVVITDFSETDIDKFSHIAELIMDQTGNMYMVYSEGNVQDVQITFTDLDGSYTVFAANCLTAGDAIMVQANDSMLLKMELSYRSGGETVKIPMKK